MIKETTYYDIRPPYCYHVFDEEISEAARITMLHIMRIINIDKELSISIVAEDLGEDVFTIKRHLDELDENGLDLWDKSQRGRSRFNIIRL